MKRYNIIPLLLTAYLGFMCYLGFPHYMSGEYSSLRYFGVTALSAGCIIALRVVMKRRAGKQDSPQNKDTNSDNTMN